MDRLPELLQALREALGQREPLSALQSYRERLHSIARSGPEAHRKAAEHLLHCWRELDESTDDEDHTHLAATLSLAVDTAAKLAGLLPTTPVPKSESPPDPAVPLQRHAALFQLSRAVCRIRRSGNLVGTGFMIAPGYILTCRHVIDSPATAREAYAEFRDIVGIPGSHGRIVQYALQSPLVHNANLDYAVVPLQEKPEHPFDDWGVLQCADLRPVVDEPIWTLHHPAGQPVSPEQFTVIETRDVAIFYESRTMTKGSSGAPLLNQHWCVVALHRSSDGGRRKMASLLGPIMHHAGESWPRTESIAVIGSSGPERRVLSALSSEPLRDRLAFDIPAVGREQALEWLRRTDGDRLLTGGSGMGKTFLCRILAREDDTFFVVDGNRDALIRAIVREQPRCLILDDAHDQSACIDALMHLRRERDFDYSIVANCWPGERDAVATALGIDSSRVYNLEPMPRAELRDVILAAARVLQVHIPDSLQQLLIEQSENRPGLAVVLTQACVKRGTRDVWNGDALFDAVCANSRLMDEEDRELLAHLALGGDLGLSLEHAARLLQCTPRELSRRMRALMAGGVVEQGRTPGWGRGTPRAEHWQVRPPMLRAPLVRRVFFGEYPSSSAVADVMDCVPSLGATVHVLMDVKARGASIPLDDIQRRVAESGGAPAQWSHFASLSLEAARFVLREHRSCLLEAAESLLYYCPEETVDALLERDQQERASAPARWSLHSVQGQTRTFMALHRWIDGREYADPETVPRRRLLLDGVERWARNGGGQDTTLAALVLVLVPDSSRNFPVPGNGMRFQWTSGYWRADALASIAALWPRVLALLEAMPPLVFAYEFVQATFRAWRYRHCQVSEAQQDILHATSERMLTDLAARCTLGQAGACWLFHLTEGRPSQARVPIDEVFHLLYGTKLDDLLDKEDWQRAWRELDARVRELADAWSRRPMGEVLDEFLAMEREHLQAAELGATQQSTDRADRMAFHLTSMVGDPVAWCEALIEGSARADIVRPFLQWALKERPDAANRLLERCLQIDDLAPLAIRLTLTWRGARAVALEAVLGALAEHCGVLDEYWAADSIPQDTMARLLRHPSARVRISTAVMWSRSSRQRIPPELHDAWRLAVLEADRHVKYLHSILRENPEMAVDWFERQLAQDRASDFWSEHWLALIQSFSRADRLRLLYSLSRNSHEQSLAAPLIGGDAALYGDWLSRTERNPRLHLAPLRHPMADHWLSLVLAALEHGYTSSEVAEHCEPRWWSTGGDPSAWNSRVEKMEELLRHPDHRVRPVVEVALAWTRQRADEARHEALERELYGR